MGLDTSHDCWVGSYTHFGMWRQEVARAAGYTLVRNADVPWPTIEIPWEMFSRENSLGDWAAGPAVEDPLIYLFVHSDAEGVIHPEQGRHLAARLEQLLPELTTDAANESASRFEKFLPALTIQRITREWLEEKTVRFIKGLRAAADSGQDVEFS